jgi:hypothetical protein
LLDIRRTGADEAQSGGADLSIIAQKMANTIGSSTGLQKTYLPVNRRPSSRPTKLGSGAVGASGRTRPGQKLKRSVREN